MPAVAKAMAADLGALDPRHTAYFRASCGLRRVAPAVAAAIAASRPPTPAPRWRSTEPVADYLLQAMGADIVTPFVFQADIMNGVDPSPEDDHARRTASSPSMRSRCSATTSRWSTR